MVKAALAPSNWLSLLKTGAYRQMAHALKTGAAPANDNEYEKALAQLGMSVLSGRVAELMPYLKGFQLLDKDDEGEFAAGFFVFDVQGTIVDIPVFMIKGRIKGYTMMFMRDRQSFLPAREGLIKYLLSSQHQSMGQVGPGTADNRMLRATPNVDVFTSNNRYLQKAANYPAHFDRWGRTSGVWEMVNGLYSDPRTAAVRSGLHNRKLACGDLSWVLSRPAMAQKLASWCQKSPRLKARVEQTLGADWQQRLSVKQARTPLLLRSPSKLSLSGRQAFGPGVSIYTGLPSSNLKTASDVVADKLEFGHFVYDTRPAAMTKMAMRIQQDDSGWAPPTATGLYSVAMVSGQPQTCLVVLPNSVVNTRSYDSGKAIVIGKDGSGAVLVPMADLPVETGTVSESVKPPAVESDAAQIDRPAEKTASLEESFTSWYESLPSVGDLNVPEDAYFMLIDSTGRCSPVLRSNGTNGDGMLSVYCGDLKTIGRFQNEENRYPLVESDPPRQGMDPIRRLRVADTVRRLTPLTSSQVADYGSELLVPKDAKILKIKTDAESSYRANVLPVLPLSSMTMDELTKVAHFSISRISPNYYRVGRSSLNVLQARQHLLGLGLSKEASAQVLRGAESKPQHYAVMSQDSAFKSWQLVTPAVKEAYGPVPQNVSIFTGDMPETPVSMSQGMIPVPEQSPISNYETVPQQYADPMDPNWSSEFSPYNQPMMTRSPSGGGLPGVEDGTAINNLNKSSDELFENTLFLSLIRHGRIDSVLSQLTSASYAEADRLARALFLMYAHQDSFIDLYGRADLELMEEQCLGLLDSTGDLLVELLQRSVDPSNDIALANSSQT